MSDRARHVSIGIDRAAAEVYAYAGDPSNLPAWASGLSSGIDRVDGRWVTSSPMGEVTVEFAPANEFGVLDHVVTLPTGEAFTNPMRVIDVVGGCEVVFTVLRMPGVTDADFDHDAATVAADLATLKRVLER